MLAVMGECEGLQMEDDGVGIAYLKHLLLFIGGEVVFRRSVDLLEEWESFSTGLCREIQMEEAECLAGMEESLSFS